MEDIEDTMIKNKNIAFTKEFVKYSFTSEDDFNNKYKEVRRKYKHGPSKPILRKTYNDLLISNEIVPNQSFLEYSLKRKVRSDSGVSVITILTSPKPKYTNKDGKIVEQDFSCGHDCAYCPKEPEIKLNLHVIDINPNINQIKVYTEDDISLISVLTYVVKENKRYDVEKCSHFKGDNFIITFHESNNDFIIGEIIVGVKIEQPRSYLHDEPAVLRANRNKFNPILQIYDRVDALESCGHVVDKIEILVLGGTWDSYPLEYQIEYIRDIYYAINTLKDRNNITRLQLNEEIKLCEKSEKRIIGLTLETRPDYVNLRQIKRLRKFNVTRLQLGVQHIDNDILEKIERGCKTNDTIWSTYLWKQNGGKIDWHLMPDLPGSSVEKDINMFSRIFGYNSIKEISKNHFVYDLKYPELQPDQLKIYPVAVTPYTKIKEWYENGSYKPYAENEEELIKVIKYIKKNVWPWIRINRIIRDIPNRNILGGNKNVNLHQQIINCENIKSKCIRSREAKNNNNIEFAELFIREYNGVNSTEYFISYESPDQEILYGFLRLRINHFNNHLIYPELNDCSFIRELHVYGKLTKHDENGNNVQHRGIGKKLIAKAEEISMNHNIFRMAIISGVGVREYYEKQGYKYKKTYMIKELYQFYENNSFEYVLFSAILIIFMSIIYDIIY